MLKEFSMKKIPALNAKFIAVTVKFKIYLGSVFVLMYYNVWNLSLEKGLKSFF